MKFLLIVACSLACAYAADLSDVEAAIVRSSYDQGPEGSFQYSYETGNGITGNAEGRVKNLGPDQFALEVVGSNGYVSPDGVKVDLTYIANENGYQPQGSHLPTPPPPQEIPDYILRAIQYIKDHPAKEDTPAKKF